MSFWKRRQCYFFLLHSFCCVIFSFVANNVNGQPLQPKFVHLNGSRDYTDIKTILPDSKNFLWFGCNRGLVRFNGSSYFRFAPGVSDKTISSTSITALYEDDKGDIWIGTADKGLFRYTYSTDKFIQIKSTEEFAVAAIGAFENNLLITANAQVFVFSTGKNELKLLEGTEHLKNKNISVVKSMANNSKEGLAWLLCSDGLYRWKEGVLYKVHNYPYSVDELGNALKTLCVVNDGMVYTATKNTGLVVFSPNANKTTIYPFSINNNKAYSTNNVDAIIGVADKQLLISTQDAGLGMFNTVQKKFSFLTQDNFPESDIFNFQATAFSSSRTYLVFATQSKGIWVYNMADASRFTSIALSSVNNKVPGTLYARSVLPCPENNTIYIGSFFGDGLYKYNTTNREIQAFPFIKNKPTSQTLIINHIYKDRSGVIWLASHENGLLIFDAEKKIIIPAIEKYSSLSSINSKKIYCIYEDKNQSLYIGSGGEGLATLNRERNRVEKYLHSNGDDRSIISDSIFAEQFFEDNKGNIWISTIRGLSVFQPATKQFYNFAIEPGKPGSIPKAFWYAVVQGNDGDIFVGTNEGLYRLKEKERNFVNAKHYSDKEGLPHNNIFSIVKDKQGLLWLTCRNGISCFNPVDETFRNFTYKEGLPAKTLMSPMSLSADGKIWHGAVENFFSFSTKSILEKKQKPQIWFTGLKIFNKDTLSGLELNTKESVKLAYRQHSFSFSFTSPELLYPETITYFYMLEGVDKDWIMAGNRNYAAYTNIKPGTYTFKVRTSGNQDNRTIRAVTIIISTPFWQRWWFIILCALAALLAGVIVIRQREKKIKQNESAKTEIEKLKAANYQYQLEIEQVVSYFATSISAQNTVDDLLWDVSKNLIGKFGFEECMIYLWNKDKTLLVQRAGYGLKGDMAIIANKNAYHVPKAKGVTGAVAESGTPLLINDTSKDSRYFSADEKIMFSELCVPLLHKNKVIGVINTENSKKHFFTDRHLKILVAIASLCADKMDKINTEQANRVKEVEVLKLHKDLAESQLTALRSQMNPHFIFNALNSVQQYILQGNSDEANRYLSKFSKLQREILTNSNQSFINLEKEKEILELYLQLEQLRFYGNFDYSITIDDEIDVTEIKIPPMLVQPFVENAIWHGLMPKQGERKVQLSFSLNGDMLECLILDNGIGREAAAMLKEKAGSSHQSKGMAIVNERLQILRQQYKQPFDVVVTDIVDGANNPTGTKVLLKIYVGQ